MFYALLEKCQPLQKGKKKFRFKNQLLSLDASTIELLSTLFNWARFRQTKGAVKLHLLLDHEGYLPVFALITEGCVHEVNVARELTFPKGSILAIDRGYTDYTLFAHWTDTGVFSSPDRKTMPVTGWLKKERSLKTAPSSKMRLLPSPVIMLRLPTLIIYGGSKWMMLKTAGSSFFSPTTLSLERPPSLVFIRIAGRLKPSSKPSNRI